MTAVASARGTMPLTDHVREARTRLTRVAAALVVGVVIGYVLSGELLDVLRAPILNIAEGQVASLNYDTVTGAFDLRLRIAIYAGLVLSSPVWIYELFGFIHPGLTPRERKHAYGFTFAAIALFVGGCAFGFLVFPHVVELLTGFSSASDSTILTASYYVDFVLRLVAAIGIAFMLPVVVVMLNFMGVISAATIRRSWRVIVVVITLFSALVTPAADVLSMFLIAVPMSALFLAAMAVAHVHDRRVRRQPDESLTA